MTHSATMAYLIILLSSSSCDKQAGVSVGGGGVAAVGAGSTATGSSSGALTGASVPLVGSQITSSGETRSSSGAGGGSEGPSQPSGYSANKVTYLLKPGEDAQTMAMKLIWRTGAASKIVQDGMYTAHSHDVPYRQENSTFNFCWRSRDGKVALRPFCQVFIARMPALYKNLKPGDESVSFESACLPGYFMRHKNYHFIIDKRDGSEHFDRESSFIVYNVMKYSRNLLLKSASHKDWYICQEKKGSLHDATHIRLDFYNGDPDVLDRCTFSFMPMAPNDNKYKNCKRVIGPVVQPAIAGQPHPHPPHLVPKVAAAPPLPSCIPVCPAAETGGVGQELTTGYGSTVSNFPVEPSVTKKTCVALNFINNYGPPFKVYSSLKHEAYLATGSGFKLKLLVDRPELHSHVIFSADDSEGKRKLLLNGKPSISEPVVYGCSLFRDVSVTFEQGNAPQEPSGKFPNTPYGAHPPTSVSHPLFLKVPLPALSPASPPPVSPPPSSPPAPSAPSSSPPSAPPHPSSSATALTPSYLPASVGQESPVSFPGESSKRGNGSGSIHYHYHLHPDKTTSACPTTCTTAVSGCPAQCPAYCC